MPTALTGSPGWSGQHPLQFGGPPLISTFARSWPGKALPLLGHVFANDGVTPNTTTATFRLLNRPNLKATTSNGSYGTITLDVEAPLSGVSQGAVIRLTEDARGGPATGYGLYPGWVYSGIAEEFPDTLTPTGVKHQVTLVPLGADLARVDSQALYTTPVDVAQIVRDAVALTTHCSCDQTSVPYMTGVVVATAGNVDFRNQNAQQIIDTCRSMAGPTWFWFCDELGRVWFQPQGSSATYTVPVTNYEERVSNGGSIVDRKNQVLVVGGPTPNGSTNVSSVYNGTSQSSIGIRKLNPAISLPTITDFPTIFAIAQNVGAVLDRVWTRISLTIVPRPDLTSPFTQRIHASQPGGAMLRTFEPTRSPLPESATIASGYSAAYLVQDVDTPGDQQSGTQKIVAGDAPVTSQSDIDNMVTLLTHRIATGPISIPVMPLNLPVTAGSNFLLSVGSGTPTMEIGNLAARGISAAQAGGRVTDVGGSPIWDTIGVIGLPILLAEVINTAATQGTNAAFADVTGAVTPSFTLTRQGNVVVFAIGGVAAQGAGGTNLAFLRLRVGSITNSGSPSRVDGSVAGFVPYMVFLIATLPAGTYTAALQANTNAGNWNVSYADVAAFLFGG